MAKYDQNFKLRIDIIFEQGADPSKSRILIEDNAAGIDEEASMRAFTPGVPPGDLSGISRFGIGMKSSALWYSSYYNIQSSALGEEVTRTVFFDVDKIIKDRLEKLPVEKTKKSADVHGTRIMLLNLNKGLPASSTVAKIKSHLASIYREYIKSGEVILTVAGEKLQYNPPSFLTSPYWPTNDGPGENIEPIEWITRVDFTLDESWELNAGENKHKPAPRVTGWVGILAKGATKSSGISLLWRKKVIVGAGNVAEGDAYRPVGIFGASTTFPYQRIFGELDLSDLEVTAFKDGFIWLEGQQEELEEKLKLAISSKDMPLLIMAKNYRQTERTPAIQDTVKDVVDDTASGLVSGLTDIGGSSVDPFTAEPPAEQPEPVGGEESARASATLQLPESFKSTIVFEVKDQPGDNSWLRVSEDPDSDRWAITLNRAHPFMDSFVHLPGADLNPVLRLAGAIGIAEIRATSAGIEKPTFMRSVVNELLRSELARRNEKD
jgi:hypothetical protein